MGQVFLQAVLESAQDATDKIQKLSDLHTKNTEIIGRMGRASKTARQLFEYLEQNPIIEIRKTAVALGMAFSTVSASVNRLCEAEILGKARVNSVTENSAMKPILTCCVREHDRICG
ncbi:MAG: winged helix-turn-helix domain-containing protein [Clostridiales bacterium]|jgi:Fic family protein|nr:winged helix-turn-helix domain-containing protein [Clostridiales bacterium]